MKKIFALEDLDCAVCAAKMESAVSKIDGVKNVSVNFIMQKMTLEADDGKFGEIVKQAIKVCKKIEPDCTIIVK
jgi:copper chaperone CopZ